MKKWEVQPPLVPLIHEVKPWFKKDGKPFGVFREVPGMHLPGGEKEDTAWLNLVSHEIDGMCAGTFGNEKNVVEIVPVWLVGKLKLIDQVFEDLNVKIKVLGVGILESGNTVDWQLIFFFSPFWIHAFPIPFVTDLFSK